MKRVVIYAVGSPILVEVEESLNRCGDVIAAGVRNFEGESFLSATEQLLAPEMLTNEIVSLPFLVPLFTPGYRQQVVKEAESAGFTRAYSLIDPTSLLPRVFELGKGSYLGPRCAIGTQSRFGEFVLINRCCSIGHHASFGNFVSIGPGVVIAGMSKIGKGSMIGTGAVIVPEITIGENAVVAAGSVVTRDVQDHCMVAGNPARIVRKDIPGYRDIAVT